MTTLFIIEFDRPRGESFGAFSFLAPYSERRERTYSIRKCNRNGAVGENRTHDLSLTKGGRHVDSHGLRCQKADRNCLEWAPVPFTCKAASHDPFPSCKAVAARFR